MTQLKDKVAIITGGSGGIGLAVGERFLQEGARVLLVDLDEANLQEAVAAMQSDAVSYCVADVTQPDQVQHYVDTTMQRYGAVDIFINNAGIEGEVNSIPDYSIEMFDQVMAVNVRGVWLGLKYVIPEMKKRNGGSIVLTSSIAGVKGTAGISAYTTSKHAVIGLMRTAALECAEFNIRINTVNPAPIETRMMESLENQSMPEDPELAREMRIKRIPLRRYGTPAEVANLMLFLASAESSYCSGGIYMVDGGITAG